MSCFFCSFYFQVNNWSEREANSSARHLLLEYKITTLSLSPSKITWLVAFFNPKRDCTQEQLGLV